MVAVVIPVRDRATLLAVTLRTVREQTAPPGEVIVADDGSGDGSPEVAARAGARVLRRPQGGWGAAGARNAGLAEARGDRVLFLDSDDLLVPDALARLGAALDSAPAAPFAFGRALAAFSGPAGWRPAGLIAAEPRELRTPLAGLFARNAVPSAGALGRAEGARRARWCGRRRRGASTAMTRRCRSARTRTSSCGWPRTARRRTCRPSWRSTA